MKEKYFYESTCEELLNLHPVTGKWTHCRRLMEATLKVPMMDVCSVQEKQL